MRLSDDNSLLPLCSVLMHVGGSTNYIIAVQSGSSSSSSLLLLLLVIMTYRDFICLFNARTDTGISAIMSPALDTAAVRSWPAANHYSDAYVGQHNYDSVSDSLTRQLAATYGEMILRFCYAWHCIMAQHNAVSDNSLE